MLARNLQDKSSGTALAGEYARLKQMRMLAARRQDWKEAAALDAQITAVEAKLPAKKADASGQEKEVLLAEVNRRNRAANVEAIRQAELRETERKRRERKLLLTASAAGTPRAGTPKNGVKKPFSPMCVCVMCLYCGYVDVPCAQTGHTCGTRYSGPDRIPPAPSRMHKREL